MTKREHALAIETVDRKVGIQNNLVTNMMRLAVIECIEEFCKLQAQELQKRLETK